MADWHETDSLNGSEKQGRFAACSGRLDQTWYCSLFLLRVGLSCCIMHISLCFSIVSSAVSALFFADSSQNSAHVARTDEK